MEFPWAEAGVAGAAVAGLVYVVHKFIKFLSSHLGQHTDALRDLTLATNAFRESVRLEFEHLRSRGLKKGP